MAHKKRYDKSINSRILLQNILIIICIAAHVFLVSRQFRREKVVIPLKDECGPIGQTISHSIDNDEACQNNCYAACTSMDHTYSGHEYIYNNEIACNNCTCVCYI